MLGRAVRQERDADDLCGARNVERFRLFGESKIIQRKHCVFHGVMPCGARSDNSYVIGATERFRSLVAERRARRARADARIPSLSPGGSAASLPSWTSPVNPKVLAVRQSRLSARHRFLAPPPQAPYRSAAFCSFREAEHMDPLIEGYRRFRAEVWPAERARYEALAHWGQSPEAMVIACSDSRVDPADHFQRRAGRIVRRAQCRGARAARIAPTPAITERARRSNLASRCSRFPAWSCWGTGSAAGSKRWPMARRRRRATSSPPGSTSASRRLSPRATSPRGGSNGSRPRSCASRSPIS